MYLKGHLLYNFNKKEITKIYNLITHGQMEVKGLNPKIDRLEKEIEKTKGKIADMQDRLRDLEKQKTELENTDYVAVARSFKLTPQELAEFLKTRQMAPEKEALAQEQEGRNED